jgi:signal transduction histidine kinase
MGDAVQLAAFIRANIERIAVDWELFAATLLPEEEFSKSVLRNSIVEMLTEIAKDMDRAQSAGQQQRKSEGDAERGVGIDTAADKHALERVGMGVSSRHLIAEFRALRATIIRLWQSSEAGTGEASLFDLIRFNEAVDQLLSHAAARYTEETDRSREMFLGILGHDLRNPLQAISGWANLQLRATTIDRQAGLASQILASSARMSHMITDLIELTRVRLGSGIVVRRAPADMRRICAKAIEEMEAIYPDRVFQLTCDNEVSGEWDAARMIQVLSNLLGNAIQHGSAHFPIAVTVTRNDREVELAVHNHGAAIPPDAIPMLFDSLFQGVPSERTAGDHSSSMGLGLYIAREIVSAHGGSIEVRSSDDEGSTFVAHLPRAGGGGRH